MGGAMEIVDQSCGFLVKPDNPALLAETLEHLIDCPELRGRLGRAGIMRARQLCDPGTQMKHLSELLHGATVRRRSPRDHAVPQC
jgi:glycosyltransferase involved in cell wall biosynthesis